MIDENCEELLEYLWIQIKEKHTIPDINKIEDQKSVKKLIENGYIDKNNIDILTPQGFEEARLCVRRHRLSEKLLNDVLHIKGNLIHETGCKLEHILKKGIEDNICILLGHPKFCPHGSPIPPGKCCEQELKNQQNILSLSELKKGQKGKLAYIDSSNEDILKKIMAMGLFPGVEITLIQKFPSCVFKFGESIFAIDNNIAEKIKIWDTIF